MKKVIKNIIFLAIVVLACFSLYKSMLERFTIDEDEVNYEEYEKLYYYNQLTEEQKQLYIRADIAINKLVPEIHLGFKNTSGAKSDVEIVLRAIYNDRPEYYFLPNEYNVKTIKFLPIEYVYVELDYEVKNEKERSLKDSELKKAVQQILYEVVTDDMTDIEKETAIHDKLVDYVTYYEYENIADIPYNKHTSYEALVNKEAVCDGISKAMMILLNEVGIDSMIVFGDIKGTAHAWNIVKLDGEYYHVDATSDAVTIDSKKYVMHNYLNMTDEALKITHNIATDFDVPECISTKYNYYLFNDYTVAYTESLRTKLTKIINKQIGSPILEIKLDKLYSTQNLLEALYMLDFNNWNTDGKTSVSYHNMEDIYIFKNNTKIKLVE